MKEDYVIVEITPEELQRANEKLGAENIKLKTEMSRVRKQMELLIKGLFSDTPYRCPGIVDLPESCGISCILCWRKALDSIE